MALFHAVLVCLWVCICVKSQTIAGRSKQDRPGRKIPPPVKCTESTQRSAGTSSVHICLSNTSIPNTHAPSCNFFLLHFQEQAVNAMSHHSLPRGVWPIGCWFHACTSEGVSGVAFRAHTLLFELHLQLWFTVAMQHKINETSMDLLPETFKEWWKSTFLSKTITIPAHYTTDETGNRNSFKAKTPPVGIVMVQSWGTKWIKTEKQIIYAT